jgi:four helix bundle protein
MKTRQFRDLVVWQRAMGLARNIYSVTQDFPKKEVFGLTSQLCRAAVSIPSNIAEGHGRLSDKSFAVFLGQARGSLYEVESQLELAHGLGYIEEQRFDQLLTESSEIGRMLNGLLNKLREAKQLNWQLGSLEGKSG